MNSDEYSNHIKENVLMYNDFQEIKKCTVNGKRCVQKLCISTFYKCLVNHFDIRFKQRSISWPSRMKIKPADI